MNVAPDVFGSLQGRHAVITGASRGIGRSIAEALSRLGANVTLIARDANALAETGKLLRSGSYLEAAADVTDAATLAAAFSRGREKFGSVAILINNAGGTESAPFLKITPAAWQKTIDLNLTAAVTTTQLALPDMLDAKFGRVVNVASTAALKGVAYASAYTAAKHALVGLTRALALECATKGVTVNAVCPGYTETPMLLNSVDKIVAKTAKSAEDVRKTLASLNPMGRFITPDEVAGAVAWLCLPSAAAISGIVLPVAGGEIG